MESSQVEVGQKKSIPGPATLVFGGYETQKGGIERKIVVTIVVSFAVSVAGSLTANWLFEKLSGRAKAIRYQKREIFVEEGEIRRIIDERLEMEQ